MKEEDIKELKEWLVDHEYYVGNSNVAMSLRKLADEWDVIGVHGIPNGWTVETASA